jgi:hypothetical protein
VTIFDRMRKYPQKQFQKHAKVIAENLDIPSLGLVSERLLNAALKQPYCFHRSMTFIGRLLNSIRLWAKTEVPGVRRFEKVDKNIWVSFQLIDRKKESIEQAWNEIDTDRSRHSIWWIRFCLLAVFQRTGYRGGRFARPYAG